MLVGTNVCVRMVFVWEWNGVPGGNPPVWLGDHMTIIHADAGYRSRVAAVSALTLRQPDSLHQCVDDIIADVYFLLHFFILLEPLV